MVLFGGVRCRGHLPESVRWVDLIETFAKGGPLCLAPSDWVGHHHHGVGQQHHASWELHIVGAATAAGNVFASVEAGANSTDASVDLTVGVDFFD